MTRSSHIVGALLIPLLILAACSGVTLHDGETRVRFSVIASGDTFPVNWHEDAVDDVLIRVAADQDAFRELWTRFRFSKAPEQEPRWEEEIVLFLATGGSSNCPPSVQDVTFDSTAGRLTIHLEPEVERPGTWCFMNFSPRTFALTLPRTLLDANWREVRVVGVSRNPTVPVPTPYSSDQG